MTDTARKFLVVSLQNSLYALDLAQVAEVGDPPQLSPIPLAPQCYSGAMGFHGDIVAVMDLPIFLGLTDSSPREKIVVLQQELASLAFLVDRVIRIVSEDDVSFNKPPSDRFAAATLQLSDGSAILLDLETLLHSAEKDMQENG